MTALIIVFGVVGVALLVWAMCRAASWGDSAINRLRRKRDMELVALRWRDLKASGEEFERLHPDAQRLLLGMKTLQALRVRRALEKQLRQDNRHNDN